MNANEQLTKSEKHLEQDMEQFGDEENKFVKILLSDLHKYITFHPEGSTFEKASTIEPDMPVYTQYRQAQDIYNKFKEIESELESTGKQLFQLLSLIGGSGVQHTMVTTGRSKRSNEVALDPRDGQNDNFQRAISAVEQMQQRQRDLKRFEDENKLLEELLSHLHKYVTTHTEAKDISFDLPSENTPDSAVTSKYRDAEDIWKKFMEMNDTNDTIKKENIKLQKALQEMNRSLSQKKETVSDLQKRLQKLVWDLESTNTVNKELQTECEKLQNTNENITKENKMLQKALQDMSGSLSQEKETVTHLQKRLQGLLWDVESTNTMKKQLQSECEKFQNTNDKINKENKMLQKALQDMDQSLSKEKEKVSDLQKRVQSLVLALESTNTVKMQLQSDCEKLQNTNDKINNENKKLQEALQDMDRILPHVRETVSDLQKSSRPIPTSATGMTSGRSESDQDGSRSSFQSRTGRDDQTASGVRSFSAGPSLKSQKSTGPSKSQIGPLDGGSVGQTISSPQIKPSFFSQEPPAASGVRPFSENESFDYFASIKDESSVPKERVQNGDGVTNSRSVPDMDDSTEQDGDSFIGQPFQYEDSVIPYSTDLKIPQLEFTIGDIYVVVFRGDITEEKSEGIVSAASTNLDNCAGIAKVIAAAAGNELQKECKDFIKRHQFLDITEVMHTKAGGRLNGKVLYVLHAAGPVWNEKLSSDETFQDELTTTYVNCFQFAEKRWLHSLSLPLISYGIFGGPIHLCVRSFIDGLLIFINNLGKKSQLQEIHLINVDLEGTQLTIVMLQQLLEMGLNKLTREALQNCDKKLTKKTATNKPKRSSILPRSYKRASQIKPTLFSQEPTAAASKKKERGHLNKEIAHKAKSQLLKAVHVSQESDSNMESPRSLKGDNSDDSLGSPRDATSENMFARRDLKPPEHMFSILSLDLEKPSHKSNSKMDGTLPLGLSQRHVLEQDMDTVCPICLKLMHKPKSLPKCNHKFCSDCISKYFKTCKPVCPQCGCVYGVIKGDQPKGGKMTYKIDKDLTVPGYEDAEGAIIITYDIPGGKQEDHHPRPGLMYNDLNLSAYLPNCSEGRLVLKLLQRAFDAGLIFTVGESKTTARDNMITWNDIHHKTSIHGGSTNFGYPDPTYLQRVQEELAAKGITKDMV